MSNCVHMNFKAVVKVSRLTDGENGPVTSYMAEVTVECAECHLPFEFMGLPGGLISGAAAVSADAQEARLFICPAAHHKLDS